MTHSFKLIPVMTTFMAVLLCPVLSLAATAEIVAIWSGRSDEYYAVFTSQKLDNGWTEPTLITRSKNRILGAAIGSSTFNAASRKIDGSAEMLAVWTEVIGQRLVLKFADSRDGVWANAKTLTTLGGENLAPTIVHDLASDPWVFWSSNATGSDDIYYSRRVDGVWNGPRMVNQPNIYPDILPRAYLDKTGNVAVEWRFLSPLLNTYNSRKKVFALDPTLKSTMAQLDDENTEAETTGSEVPDTAHAAFSVNLHYPLNVHDQSIYVQSN